MAASSAVRPSLLTQLLSAGPLPTGALQWGRSHKRWLPSPSRVRSNGSSSHTPTYWRHSTTKELSKALLSICYHLSSKLVSFFSKHCKLGFYSSSDNTVQGGRQLVALLSKPNPTASCAALRPTLTPLAFLKETVGQRENFLDPRKTDPSSSLLPNGRPGAEGFEHINHSFVKEG